MKSRLLAVFLLCSILLPAAAAAQERGHTGIVMGFPTSFGFIWHATDTLAVRPDFTFSHNSSEHETSILGLSSSSSGDAFTFGTSLLWYRGKVDNVRTYFSPRIAYGRASSESSSSSSTPVKTDAVSISGSFGAQYSPVRRFSVFAEVGYGFSRSTTKLSTPISTNKTTARSWATRTAVGGILYLGK